jgi:O-methyltransferase/8-demethyl-8-(2,3-dimethoxy-alpha-L-rhamnosyl)tetracenomycin-C 4'-O-methyltransferase
MAKYHIGIIRPQGYQHSDCFREVAEGLQSALRSLGHTVTFGENTVDAQAHSIVLGAHLLTEQEIESLPASAIVYNLEQLGSPNLPSWYPALGSRVRIWDYSPLHLDLWRESWKQAPHREAPALVEVGFAPELRRIPSISAPKIDVLFYGSVNERRRRILAGLEAAGLKVHAAFGVYGRERDALIAHSKVVLNLHAYESKVFEIVRVSYLLANAKAVVTEDAPDLGGLRDAVAVFPEEELIAGCVALVKDDAARRGLEARGFRIFSARSQARILEGIVGRAEQPMPVAAATQGIAVPELQKLYLDMVQRSVINTIYEDPNHDRWQPHEFNKDLRELGRDWPTQAHSMIGNKRMGNLREIAECVLECNIPGDFIETGVWRGGACIMMRAVLKAYGDTRRRVFVADSFCGLPAPNPEIAADAGDQHYTFSELFVSSEQVRANFAKYGLLDSQVCFLEGWFSDTLPSAPIEQIAILRLDGDMYESTMDALNALFDRVTPGGFIIIDDYGAVEGCQRAIREFRALRGIDDPLYDIDGYGAFWRKSAAIAGTHETDEEGAGADEDAVETATAVTIH